MILVGTNVGFFHRDDRGSGLAEYCLLVAFIAIVALVIIYHVSGGLQGIWSSANAVVANTPATGTQPSGNTGDHAH